MKLALLAVCVGAFLAVPGIAAAASPQLTGSATLQGGESFAISTPVVDGGTSYVGAGNDLSGTCNGDSGTLLRLGLTYNVVCAHFVASSGCCNAGSPKMRIAYRLPGTAPTLFYIVRITDNGGSPDTIADGGATTSLAVATAVVNKGLSGSGSFITWTFHAITSGGYTVGIP